MTNREESDAIRSLLLRICEKWKAEERGSVELAETVILGPGGPQVQGGSVSPPSKRKNDQELITETVILTPADRNRNSFPGLREEDPAKGRAPKQGEEDFLAETVILDRKKEPKQGR